MGDMIRKFLVVMVAFNFAVTLVGLVDIFPIHIGIAGFDVYDDINTRIEDTYAIFLHSSGWWDYTTLAISMLTNGIVIMFSFLLMIVFGLPLVMYSVGFPLAMCAAIATPVAVLLLYEISNKFTRVV